jgi:DNA-binding response OmpR family regulator
MVMPDPIKQLQQVARIAAEHVAPGERTARVVVLDSHGVKVLDVRVPASMAVADEPPTGTAAGWNVTDRSATFDGQTIAIKGRNLDVLRVLAAGDIVTVDELRTAWGEYRAEESTIRWQVSELRKTLKKFFGDFPGDLIESTGTGYRLLLR